MRLEPRLASAFAGRYQQTPVIRATAESWTWAVWGEKRGTSDFLKHAMPEPPVDSSRTSNFPIIPRGRGERTLSFRCLPQ